MHSRFIVVAALLSFAGCDCTPPVVTAKGEIEWTWTDREGGFHKESNASYNFGELSMGARRDVTFIVGNVGTASFDMTEMVQLLVENDSAVSVNGVGRDGQEPAFLVTFDSSVTLAPTEETTVEVAFVPPVETAPSVNHFANLELRAEKAKSSSTLGLTGRALGQGCELPSVIDFGRLPVGSTRELSFSISNGTSINSPFKLGGVTEVPSGIYTFPGIPNGEVQVAPGASATITVRFKAEEEGDYTGKVSMQRAPSCDPQEVTLKGAGVTTCITFTPNPADAASGTILSFGAVPPGQVKEGTVTFHNSCGVEFVLDDIFTNRIQHVVTLPEPHGAIDVPAAVQNSDGTWTPGSALTVIDFRPTQLGYFSGLLLGEVHLLTRDPDGGRHTEIFDRQPNVAVGVIGVGGGAVINVTPKPLNFGRVGFVPGATNPLIAQRALTISNIGTQPVPPNNEANLHLGPGGIPAITVDVLQGDPTELCVGNYDAVGNTCPGGLPSDYVVNVGIIAGQRLVLPVRLIPATEGQKEYVLHIASNDIATPDTEVRVLATTVAAPPCNYTLSPSSVNFATVSSGGSYKREFLITNIGTQEEDVCYFSAFDLDPASHPYFELAAAQSTLPDGGVVGGLPLSDGGTYDIAEGLVIAAGATEEVPVWVKPLQAAQAAEVIEGTVTFSVPGVAGNTGAVPLSATISPSCLSIQPNPLVFPDTRSSCQSSPRSLVVNNTCTTVQNYESVTLTDNASGQFVLVTQPPAGNINPGGQKVISLSFTPAAEGPVTGSVTVRVAGADFIIPLEGTGIAPPPGGQCVAVECPGPITVLPNTSNTSGNVSLTPTITAQTAYTCQWTVPTRPAGSTGQFRIPPSPTQHPSPATCSPVTYDADVIGTHIITFTVSAGGETAQCTTPVTVVPNGDLWVELTWNNTIDLDLWLMRGASLPNQPTPWDVQSNWTHSTQVNRWNVILGTGVDTQEWGMPGVADNPFLDRDVISEGYGPENMRISTPELNVDYAVGVHHYTSSVNPNGTTGTIKVYCGGSLIATETYSYPAARQMWVVGWVRFPMSTSTCVWNSGSTIFPSFSP